ncbi:50S ribosomal protein L18 [Candidatus Woesearchaeota archaeon]|nr:50S ribosomal protein L18 [Candidatus Woesearchaeota archaeon]
MTSKKDTLGYRRKREGKTNYKIRLALLKSKQPRLVIRKSLKNITAQVVEYYADGDKVIITADSKELKKNGWKVTANNLPAAYLTGLLLAKKALAKGIKKGIADFGLQRSTKGSKLYALIKGAIDGGFEIACSEEILPSDERVSGKHIEEFAKSLASDKKSYKKQFSAYLNSGTKPEELSKLFQKVKQQIMGA